MATEEEKETVIFHGVDKRVVMIQIWHRQELFEWWCWKQSEIIIAEPSMRIHQDMTHFIDELIKMTRQEGEEEQKQKRNEMTAEIRQASDSKIVKIPRRTCAAPIPAEPWPWRDCPARTRPRRDGRTKA
jgi:hypothetical protein